MEVLNIEEQLRRERDILERGQEGLAVFLNHLNVAADKMLQEYDKCDLTTTEGLAKAMRAQTFRDIVNREIPRMMENIMNVDREPDRLFKFWKWLNKFR